MADEKDYTIVLTIDGKQVDQEALRLRKVLEEQIAEIAITGAVKIEGLEQSAVLIAQIREDAGGLGRAVGAGLSRTWTNLEEKMSGLQQKISGLIEHGKTVDFTKEITDQSPELEQALTIGTKKALEQSLAIREVNAALTEMYTTRARLRGQKVQPLAGGETRQVSELMRFFGESRHMQNKVKKFVAEMNKELRPLQKEVDRELGAAKMAAEKQISGLIEEMSRVTVEMQAMEAERPSFSAGLLDPQAGAAFDEGFVALKNRHQQLEQEIGRHRSALAGVGGSEAQAKLELAQRQRLEGLAEQTPFWREVVLAPEQLAQEYRAGMQREAADAFEQLLAVEKEISRHEGLLKRRTGALMKGAQATLPQTAEGTMVDFVQAERALEAAAMGATDQLDRQYKRLGTLTTRLDDARLALGGLTKAQRLAVARTEAAAMRDIRAGTTKAAAPTLEAAAANSRAVLGRLTTEIHKTTTMMEAELSKDMTEGATTQARGLVRVWTWVQNRLVGGSIIPEMVGDINNWLDKLGSETRFDTMAQEGENAAARIVDAFGKTAEALPVAAIEGQITTLSAQVKTMEADFNALMVSGRQQSQRYKAQFQEAVEQARNLRGFKPEDEAKFAEGFLPRGFSVSGSGESQFQKEKGRAERLSKGIKEDTNQWYRALNTDLQERKRWTGEEKAHMDQLGAQITSKQAQIAALTRARLTKLADQYADALGGAGSEAEYAKIFGELEKVQADLGAATADLEGQVVMVSALAQDAKQKAAKATKVERKTKARGVTAEEKERLELIKTAGKVEVEAAWATRMAVVEEEKRKTRILKSMMAQRDQIVRASAQEQKKVGQAQQMAGQMGLDWQQVVRWQRESASTTDQVLAALKRTRTETTRLNRESKKLAQTQEKTAGLAARFVSNLREARMARQSIFMVAQDLQNLGRTAQFAGTAIVGSMTLAGRSYLELAAQSDVAARSLGLGQEMTSQLRQEVVGLASDMALVDPQTTAKGVTIWAQATGQQVNELSDLQGVLEQTVPMMQLAALSQVDLGTATDGTAQTLRQFGLGLDDTTRVVAIFNQVADDTLAEVSDVTQAFKFVGPQARAMGIDIEEAAAVLGLWADQGIKGSTAGRAMRQTLLSIAEPSEEAKDRLVELFGTGSPFYDAEGQFRGYAEMIDMITWATEKMTDAERDALVATLFTANAVPAITASITAQRKARERDINVIRARTKQIRGDIDSEVKAYADLRMEVDGASTTMVGALDLWNEQWGHYEQSDVRRVKQAEMRWKALWLAIGENVVTFALPHLERAGEFVTDLTSWVQQNPWVGKIGALVGAGAITVGTVLAAFSTTMKGVTTFRTLVATIRGTLNQQRGTAQHFNMEVRSAGETFRSIIVSAAEQAAAIETAGAEAETGIETAGAVEEATIEKAGAVDEALIEKAGAVDEVAIETAGGATRGGLGLLGKVALPLIVGQALSELTLGQGMEDWFSTQEGAIAASEKALALQGQTTEQLTAELEQVQHQLDLLGKFTPGIGSKGSVFDVLLPTDTDYKEYEELMGGRWKALSGPVYADKLEELTLLQEELQNKIAAGNGELAGFGESLGRLGWTFLEKAGLADDARAGLDEFGQAIEDLYEKTLAGAEGVYDGIENAAAVIPLTDKEKKAVDLYIEYMKRQADETEKFTKRMGELSRDLAKDLARIDRDYFADLEDISEDYHEDELKREDKRRREAEKRARDHAIKMQRMEEDHTDRIFSLVQKRDALGIVQENRQYDKQRRRAEEDFARSEGDTTGGFEREREARKKEHEKRLLDRQIEWEREKEERRIEFADEQEKAQREHDETMARLEQDYFDKINAELDYYKRSEEELARYQRLMLEDTNRFLASNRNLWLAYLAGLPVPTGGTAPTAADVDLPVYTTEGGTEFEHGGYAGRGLYSMGEAGREFVVDSPTTSKLEGFFGPLTQDKLAQGFAGDGGGGGGNHFEFNQTVTITDARDPEKTGRIVRTETFKVLDEVFREVD